MEVEVVGTRPPPGGDGAAVGQRHAQWAELAEREEALGAGLAEGGLGAQTGGGERLHPVVGVGLQLAHEVVGLGEGVGKATLALFGLRLDAQSAQGVGELLGAAEGFEVRSGGGERVVALGLQALQLSC